MKLTIDTEAKTIIIEGSFDLEELNNFMIRNDQYAKFEITATTNNYHIPPPLLPIFKEVPPPFFYDADNYLSQKLAPHIPTMCYNNPEDEGGHDFRARSAPENDSKKGYCNSHHTG